MPQHGVGGSAVHLEHVPAIQPPQQIADEASESVRRSAGLRAPNDLAYDQAAGQGQIQTHVACINTRSEHYHMLV